MLDSTQSRLQSIDKLLISNYIIRRMQPISSQNQPPINQTPLSPASSRAAPQINIKKTYSNQIQSPKQTRKQNTQDNNVIFEVQKVEVLNNVNKNNKQRAFNFKSSSGRVEPDHRQSTKIQKNETKFDKRSVSKAIQQSLLQCPNSLRPNHINCKICNDTGRTSQQSPLIKFFLYVLNYKLDGQNHSFHRKRSNRQFKSTKQPAKQPNYRFRLSTCSSSSTKPDITHYGYYCNGCESEEPIIGVRYNCLGCPDYDLCNKCFQKKGHQHRMKRIEVPVGYHRAEQMAKNMRRSIEMRGSLNEVNDRLIKLQKEIMRRSLK